MNGRLWPTRGLYIGADIVVTVLVLLVFNTVRYHLEVHDGMFGSLAHYILHPNTILSQGATLLFALLVYWLSGYYNNPFAKSRLADFTTSACSALIISVAVFLFVVSDDDIPLNSYYLRLYGILIGLLFAGIYIGRSCMTNYLLWRSNHDTHRKRILLVAEGNIGAQLAQWIEGAGRMHIAHQTNLMVSEDETYLRQVSKEIIAAAHRVHADEVVFATTDCSFVSISRILYRLYVLRLPIKLSPRSIPYAGIKLRVASMVGEPLADLTACNMSESSRNIKWLTDKLASALGLLLLSPLMAYIAWRVRRSSPGDVFYRQERIGLGGRPFTIYKFRSMYLDAEANGPQLSREHDKRITDWGRTMRKYRLDELPQLWNVLRGDMSLVGPRPERAHYIEQLMEFAPQLFLLHNVRPGITSWAMVRYGYASSLSAMQERMAYDWLYYENMSIRLDLVILFYTIQTILKGKGK